MEEFEEFEALSRNKVWELTDAPQNLAIIDCKWTYKLKRQRSTPQGKACRTIFKQKEGIDYHETHSPVIPFHPSHPCSSGQRTKDYPAILYKNSFSLRKHWRRHIYEAAWGIWGRNREDLLKRSLWGLKQFSRCWNWQFIDFLTKIDLMAVSTDSYVFTRQNNCEIILAICIDDRLIIAEYLGLINELLDEL